MLIRQAISEYLDRNEQEEPQTMMIDVKFEDVSGRKWPLYTVRPDGRGSFIVVDKVRNVVVAGDFSSRDEAWQYLKTTTDQ